MIHLTLTGYESMSKRILCQTPITMEDKHYHAMYWRDWDNKELCPKCKEIWENDDE